MTSQEPTPGTSVAEETEVLAPATPGAEALGTDAAEDSEED